jgi:hypothetical protein
VRQLRRQIVHGGISAVAKDKAAALVEHAHAMRNRGQRNGQSVILAIGAATGVARSEFRPLHLLYPDILGQILSYAEVKKS